MVNEQRPLRHSEPDGDHEIAEPEEVKARQRDRGLSSGAVRSSCLGGVSGKRGEALVVDLIGDLTSAGTGCRHAPVAQAGVVTRSGLVAGPSGSMSPGSCSP